MHPNDVPLIAKLSDGNICLSGGAAGADTLWGEEAVKLGHQVIHWSFEGHKYHCPSEHVVRLDLDLLKEADIHLEEANLSMKRYIPYYKPWLINLLRRNWFQVKYAHSVYAVGTLNDNAVISDVVFDPSITRFRLGPDVKVNRMGIDGGTAWACQMYLDYFLERDMEDGFCDDEWEFKLIFYDQETKEFLQFNPYTSAWHRTLMPMESPTGIYAAIGSRNLLPNGEAYIRLLMEGPPA